MTLLISDTAPSQRSDLHAHADVHACPVCQGALQRTWRRPVDRFLGHFVPLQRYRCATFTCQWEGNIRMQRQASTAPDSVRHGSEATRSHLLDNAEPTPVPKSFVGHMALTVAGAMFVVVFAYTDWFRDAEITEARDANWYASVRLTEQGARLTLPSPVTPPAPEAGRK